MSKPYPGDWVLRSVLFVPGHIEPMMKKGADTDADCVILDLEDAVPADWKLTARKKARRILDEGVYAKKTVFVRINALQTSLSTEDIAAVACGSLNGFVYPRANCAEDLQRLDSQLGSTEEDLQLPSGHFSLITVIETTRAMLNVRAVAEASPRIVALIFGCEDFLADLQGRHSDGDIALLAPRAQVALAARAIGAEPIDTPYVRVGDLDGLRRFAETGRDLGMAGMCALTPRQVDIVNEVYTPSAEEAQSARQVIEAAENPADSDRGVFIAEGKFISPPTVKAARKTISRHEAICNLQKFYQKV